MAVQKSKVTRSRRGQRRSHDALGKTTLSVDETSGEKHLRHNVSPEGFIAAKKLSILALTTNLFFQLET